jgi:hypothetical protein
VAGNSITVGAGSDLDRGFYDEPAAGLSVCRFAICPYKAMPFSLS